MKKLISIFAAVILVLSAFAAIPASAAEVVLYSQNFDGVATPADAGFPDVDSRSSGATPFAGTLSIVDGKLKATTEAANSKLHRSLRRIFNERRQKLRRNRLGGRSVI